MAKILILALLIYPLQSHASDDFESYDDIVDRLSADTEAFQNLNRLPKKSLTRAHAGIGMSQTFYQSNSLDGDKSSVRHGGMMLTLGVDLLSPMWAIEGVYHNFGQSEGSTTRFQLKEVALQLLYKPTLNKFWTMRFGGGLSSRFLQVTQLESQARRDYQTPSILAGFGLDRRITSSLSVGMGLNIKSALIEDTIDRRSVDVALRIDTHF